MTVPWSAVRRSAVRRWRTRTPLAAAHPGTILAAIVLAMIVLAGVGAPWLAPHDPLAQLDVIALKNRAPTFAFPLGTDPYSRDVLSRALFGARTSLLVGFVGAGVAVLLALAWGTCAGIAHARMGDRLMRLVDALRALPFNHRAALALRFHEQMTDREIAETLGCRIGSVGPWIQRGLAKLRMDLS